MWGFSGHTRQRTILATGIGLASLAIIGAGLFAVVSSLNSDPVQLPEEGSLQEILDSGTSQGDQAPNAEAGAPVYQRPPGPRPVRIGVPKLYIDAPVVALGFEPDTTTPAVPDRPDQVAWYDFTTTPGRNSNAVFTGHVDWQTPSGAPIPGVFYRLRELRTGDDITVSLEDGTTLNYRVSGDVATKYDDPNVVRAMNSTSRDVVTLITCGGSWIRNLAQENGGNYSHRIIVRAELVVDGAAANLPDR